jgi:hypothetical protein
MNRIKKPTPLKFLWEFFELNLISKFIFFVGHKKIMLTDNEFIESLISGNSLYRWGDGETAICRGKAISYQTHEAELARRLLQILKIDSVQVIHGISWAYFESLLSLKWNPKNIKVFLSTKLLLSKHLDINTKQKTVETMIWYNNFSRITFVAKEISNIKQVVLIASDSRFRSSFPKNTIYIPARKKDCFSDYQTIHREIARLINHYAPKELAIFVAIGPTSKLVVLDFYQVAQVIDIGHGLNFLYDGPRMYAWKTDYDKDS